MTTQDKVSRTVWPVLQLRGESAAINSTGQRPSKTGGKPDIEAVLAQVESHWKDQTDFQVERRTARDGTPEVDISGRYGAGH